MSEVVIAWDIETCPTSKNALSDAQQSRYDKELRARQDKRPDEPAEEASRLVRSVHPFLGWICSISAVSGRVGDGPNEPYSWTAATPSEEADLLSDFWEKISRFDSGVRWATFNGKFFDVPWITARSLHHGISPSRSDLVNTYPYNQSPHADLQKIWPQSYSLDGLCGLLGVPSPKGEMDGSGVAGAVAEGRVNEVAAYGERDVVATFRCLQAAWPLLSS